MKTNLLPWLVVVVLFNFSACEQQPEEKLNPVVETAANNLCKDNQSYSDFDSCKQAEIKAEAELEKISSISSEVFKKCVDLAAEKGYVAALACAKAGGPNSALKENATAQGETNEQKPHISPETIVTFNDGAFACLEKKQLQELLTHMVKGELTKAKALDYTKGGGCTFLAPSVPVKVISSDYPDDGSDLGLLEVVGTKVSAASEGAWVLSVGATPVR